MLFCGFDIADDIPDESTICRFRNRLIKNNLLEKLLDEVNSQLSDLGLKVRKANMAILDATLIESGSRPKNKILEEEIPEDRSEDEFKDSNNKNSQFKELPTG